MIADGLVCNGSLLICKLETEFSLLKYKLHITGKAELLP